MSPIVAMMPFLHSPNTRKTSQGVCLRWVWCAIACIFGMGCRQRAYTELYFENMANEVRMLEDRIWEYDAAYREKDSEYESLVQEVARLKKRNSELQRKQSIQKPDGEALPMSPATPLKLSPNQYETNQIKPRVPAQSVPNQYEVPSVLAPENLENPPVVSKTPVSPPSPSSKNTSENFEELLPPPALPENPKSLLGEPQGSNGIRLPKRNPSLPDISSLTEQVSLPDSMVRSAQQPKLTTLPDVPSESTPLVAPSEKPLQPGFVPSLLQRRFPKSKEGNPQGAIQRGKIRLPEGSKVQFASATEPIADSKPKAVDQKIVEIAFHPTMCRGRNFDDKPGDDGLYLVVTPLNADSQVINQAATLTVIVEDPAARKDEARVGAWEFTPEQLAELLEPVGADQGFHLSLPWQAQSPTNKVVSVFLRYTSPNGRTLVNHREVYLRVPAHEQQVWTPRKTGDSK